MENQNKEVIKRVYYFINNYLSWLSVFLVLVLVCILFIHYKNKTCIFEKKKKPLLENKLINVK